MRSVPVPTPASQAGGPTVAEINFTHAHDRAVVFFAGQLDWPAAHELADTIGIVVKTYFYRRAELARLRQLVVDSVDFHFFPRPK